MIIKAEKIILLSFLLHILLISTNQQLHKKHPKHKHPGYAFSSNKNIEYELIDSSEMYHHKTNIEIENENSKTNYEKKQEEEKVNYWKKKIMPNEEDSDINKNNNDENDILNLDQELQKRQQQSNSQINMDENSTNKIKKENIEKNSSKREINNNRNRHPIDMDDEEFVKEESEIRRRNEEMERRRRNKNPNQNYNPRREKIVEKNNLNHGRGYPGPTENRRGPNNMMQGNMNQNNEQSTTKKIMNVFYQIIIIFFAVSFVYNFLFGKSQNDKHALVWYQSNKEYFEERYEYFGIDDTENNKKNPRQPSKIMRNCKLIKESPYYYKLTCASYRYIQYFSVVLEFHKRYDATSILTSLFVTPKDKIIFQVSFDPIDKTGWIFCVTKKRQVKSLKKSYEDLNYFCQMYEPSSFNNYMCLLSESLEVFMELFNNKNLFHYYKSIEDYLEAIYYSDMVSMYVEGNNIFFSFNIDLTKPNQERTLLEITHFVNLFADTLAQLKYTKEFKEKVKHNRIMFERTKMDDNKRKEIEEKEKHDFIEKWKIKNKMRNKKGAERRKLERELGKYQ